MSNQNLVLISFNRDQLQMVDHDGQPYVVMKPIVKALKLNWSGQQAKLLENKQKFSYMAINTTGIDGKTYEMGCTPLKKLNGWLFSINANNIPNLATRSKVEKYQEECFEVLWNYWLNKSKSPLELLMEAKFKMENEPVNLMSFEQISYSERLAQRRFTWQEFQEFFNMKDDNYFLRVIVGIINRQVLGMSAGNFRRQVLGPQRVRMINGERVRLDVTTNNLPVNLTKDFLPKPHQECIQRVMQDLFEYYMARPNWNRADVRIKVKEFILTRKSSIERIIGRPLHVLVLECIQQVSTYSETHNVSPYDVIQNNLVQLNYNQLALERDIRQQLSQL